MWYSVFDSYNQIYSSLLCSPRNEKIPTAMFFSHVKFNYRPMKFFWLLKSLPSPPPPWYKRSFFGYWTISNKQFQIFRWDYAPPPFLYTTAPIHILASTYILLYGLLPALFKQMLDQLDPPEPRVNKPTYNDVLTYLEHYWEQICLVKLITKRFLTSVAHKERGGGLKALLNFAFRGMNCSFLFFQKAPRW